LRHTCLTWALITHLNTYNTSYGLITHLNTCHISYGQKKGRESICQFDSRPLKVKNHLELHAWRWRTIYHWKDLDKGYNFASYFTSIEHLYKKLWASKVLGVSIFKILGLPTWESREKWHLDATPMVNHRKYYKGKGGGFPQVRAMVGFVSPCGSSMHQKCFNYALTNLLFGLCRFMQMIHLSFILIPSWSFSMPL